ncbi:hypothetical protein ACLI09_16205 [Flavobacterium sp. RHBU_24]|uniref:hypothetical protein n=1 Tax=Flavobacterium sp. RHBU_24 TaxID=3391185 RepID=UPI003984B5A6
MENTASLSLLFYGIIILVAMIAFVVIIRKIGEIDTTQPNAENEMKKIDKITDISKYVIVSVILSTVTVAISDQFKERDYDKNEMAAFDKYIPYVVDTTTIDNKINLCEFFCYVTPEGDLKKGWMSYKNHLVNKKDALQLIDKTSKGIDTKTAPLNQMEIKKAQQKLFEKEQILVNNNITDNGSYLVIISADDKKSEADHEAHIWKDKYKYNIKTYKKGKWYRTVIPVDTGLQDANNLIKEIKLKSGGKKNPYAVSFKTWCINGNYSQAEGCVICN